LSCLPPKTEASAKEIAKLQKDEINLEDPPAEAAENTPAAAAEIPPAEAAESTPAEKAENSTAGTQETLPVGSDSRTRQLEYVRPSSWVRQFYNPPAGAAETSPAGAAETPCNLLE